MWVCGCALSLEVCACCSYITACHMFLTAILIECKLEHQASTSQGIDYHQAPTSVRYTTNKHLPKNPCPCILAWRYGFMHYTALHQLVPTAYKRRARTDFTTPQKRECLGSDYQVPLTTHRSTSFTFLTNR